MVESHFKNDVWIRIGLVINLKKDYPVLDIELK